MRFNGKHYSALDASERTLWRAEDPESFERAQRDHKATIALLEGAVRAELITRAELEDLLILSSAAVRELLAERSKPKRKILL